MTTPRCACGYTPAGDETLTDHLAEMFTPPNDTDPHGQLHAESVPGKCLCGHTTATPAALDHHLLTVFTPPHHTGPDGHVHTPAADTP